MPRKHSFILHLVREERDPHHYAVYEMDDPHPLNQSGWFNAHALMWMHNTISPRDWERLTNIKLKPGEQTKLTVTIREVGY